MSSDSVNLKINLYKEITDIEKGLGRVLTEQEREKMKTLAISLVHRNWCQKLGPVFVEAILKIFNERTALIRSRKERRLIQFGKERR